MRLSVIFIMVFCFFTASISWAVPAIVYTGKVGDSAYNESLSRGIDEFRKKTGEECIEIEGAADGTDYIKHLLQCIRENHSPVILPYSEQFGKLSNIMREHKATNFIFMDFGDVDLPNVWAFSFADDEGAFLAGALAVLMSKTNIVGFVCTSDEYPVLVRFRSGYIQGAKTINPDVKVLEGQLGNYPGAWHDTDSARKVAAKLIDQGADVLFAAAGFAGTGVLAQAAERHVYAIGVDSNQNHLHPGTMIGSLLKRNDKAVFIALKLSLSGIHRDGIKRLGLAQDAMVMDFEGVQEGLVPDSVKKRLELLKAQIVQGKRRLKDDFK